jgi:rhodanese-related sulfurtransferase
VSDKVNSLAQEAIMSILQTLSPPQAWALIKQTRDAKLVDVRDPLEFSLVGHPPGAINIPWKFAPDWKPNPHFLEQIQKIIPDTDTPLFMLCRSGQRSNDAALLLLEHGYNNLVNIAEGFEGGLDEWKQRGKLNGWRFHHLPWEQS